MRALEFILERKDPTLRVGDLIVDVDTKHLVDQYSIRHPYYLYIDRIVNRLPKIKDEIMAIEPGQQFWVYSTALDTALGFRKSGESNRLKLKTVVTNRPWTSDVPVIDII